MNTKVQEASIYQDGVASGPCSQEHLKQLKTGPSHGKLLKANMIQGPGEPHERKTALLNGSYKQNLRSKSRIINNMTTDKTNQGNWLCSYKGTATQALFLSSSARGTGCEQISLPERERLKLDVLPDQQC